MLRRVRVRLHNFLLPPHFGWEALFELDSESVIICSHDLQYLWEDQVRRALEQVVFVSKQRVICKTLGYNGNDELGSALQRYNDSHPKQQVNKVIFYAGAHNPQVKTSVSRGSASRPT